jgi:hypothetical protein
MVKSLFLALWLFVLGGLLFAQTVHAQPVCDDPVNLPNPIYLSVGDTQVNLMRELGAKLRAAEQITLIWRATGSCTNLDTLYGDVKMSGNFSYIPAGYDPQATPNPPVCSVPSSGVLADIANSIVFLEGCPTPKPNDVADIFGPVQSFAFVVPRASSQTAITAEEAYFVFGFGMAGKVTPWLDNNLLLGRPVTKGTVISIGASIGVPAGKWQGQKINLSQDLASQLAASPDPEKALGILGSEVYDSLRSTLKALAFRAYKQRRAYFTDSTAIAFDKQNVRDGHYHLWSYTRWLQKLDSMGKPRKAAARRVIDILVGNPVTPPATFESLDATVKVGLIPRCAMKVERKTEGGDFSLFQSETPCGCYFDFKATGSTSCSACSEANPCKTGVCRHGYCEAR